MLTVFKDFWDWLWELNTSRTVRYSRLHLEWLEARIVPSTTTWVGGTGLTANDWGTAVNWSRVVPGPNDDAILSYNSLTKAGVSVDDDSLLAAG